MQSLTYAGGGLSYTQNFGYDSLNRLSTANENSGASWSQTNGYDQYGNRWIDYGGGVHNLAFSTSNNRITTAGFSYDANGNLTNDTIHAYTFDAEDKIKTVDAVTAYTYDGEGQRVRKFVGENTRFVYGIGGQLIAEFDGSTGNLKKEYLYGGATLITIEPTAVNSNGTQYTTTDNLASPRVITNASGSVVSRHDYLPFGEELCAGMGGRTTGMGFCGGGDTNRKKFTGYERDTETGLDFAQARYFSSTEGRFTSADTLLGSLANPQSLNRYAYVVNNPLNSIDPTGHLPVSATGPAPGEWGDSEGPAAPGDLPARYELEIARIKQVIAENEAAGSAENESAPDPVHEVGHLDEEATGGGERSGAIGASEAGDTQEPKQQYSSNSTMAIIWDGVDGYNPDRWYGHVSYITMQDDQSYSWQGIAHWTQNHPSSDYTNERSKDSAGTGYILDFGPKINEKFQNALIRAYDRPFGLGKRVYDPIKDNCGEAFVIAIRAIKEGHRCVSMQFLRETSGNQRIHPDNSIEVHCRSKVISETLARIPIRRKAGVITLIPNSLIVFFSCAAMLIGSGCMRDSYQVKLSGPVEIHNEWVEFMPKEPLKVDKTFQWVVLELEPPLRNDIYKEGKGPASGGILMPDGEVINPEIEVIDQYGNKFSLVWRGGFGFKPGYRPQGEYPRDREYTKVRIRSARPIKCKSIYWFCDSSKDWK